MEDSKRTIIKGKAVVIDGNDIDTDRIIPARFLRSVTFDGLGEHAFEDDRKQLAALGKTHPFDDPERQGAEILLTGNNFGCGSSREHAPQALMRWNRGIKAIAGESFAEIFFGNCVVLGIPCVTVGTADLRRLRAAAAADADADFTVDLLAHELRTSTLSVPAHLPEGPRVQLTSGRWDSTAELLDERAAVSAALRRQPYASW